MGIIYHIKCETTGKSYIGQTMGTINQRISQHKCSNSGCRYLSRAIQKYGWDNFKVNVLWEGDDSLLNEMEVKYIDEMNTLAPHGYNLASGGRNFKHSEESRLRMAEVNRERQFIKRGVLGSVSKNTCGSWRLTGCINGKTNKMTFETEKEVLEAQLKYTENPEAFIFEKKIAPPGSGSVNFHGGNFEAYHKGVYLGGFETEKLARGAIKKYVEDPENYINPNKKRVGSIWITPSGKFKASYKNKYIGRFATKEEADAAIKKYIENPENYVIPNNQSFGSIKRNGNKYEVKCKHKYLGMFKTREEAEAAINKYIEDPDNYVNPNKKRVGSIWMKGNKYTASYKNKQIGSFATKEEAENAINKYIENPENYVIPNKRRIGSISTKGNKYEVSYKNKYIGTFATKEEAENAIENYIRT